jgi:NDP-4-keto-2,6-dideoxyhexose 3-C-methyltransferase
MSSIIKKCRICGNEELVPIISLGNQCLTSVFPRPDSDNPSISPLDLLFCSSKTKEVCNLVQLKHNADIEEMYGSTYGYFSSISPTMVSHLSDIMDQVINSIELKDNDTVLDIGCNDGTFLNLYKKERCLNRVGIDPSSEKFKEMFDDDIKVSYNFFSEKKVREIIDNNHCKVISSIAMFYDIDDPIDFAKGIKSLLTDDGIWVVEVAYLPLMMTNLAYDQIMHEHLTYLGLKQMKWIMDKVDMEIIDISLNNINGGSITIIAGNKSHNHKINSKEINLLIEKEKQLEDKRTFERFARRIASHKNDLNEVLEIINQTPKTIMGYGASTKGNVVLNYCDIKPSQLIKICDQNPEKPGLLTPGSRIPIISKDEMRKVRPDYLLVLIWHFRKEVIEDEIEYINDGGTLIFNLPRIHFVNKSNYKEYMQASFDDLSYSL